MSVSVVLLPCRQMLRQQHQLITPQLEFSPRTIHMGFQMDSVTFGQVFLRALRVVPVSYRSISLHIHPFITVDGQWAHYRPHFQSLTPPHQTKRTIILLAFQSIGQFSLNSPDNPP